MTVARSRPDHNLCVARHGKSLGVSEVRGQMAFGGQTMGQIMWTRESLGVSGDQSMWTRELLGVSGGQIMLTRKWLGVTGGQIMLTREWLGVSGGQVPESSCPSARCSMN